MKKQEYKKPEVQAVSIHMDSLLTQNSIQSVEGNGTMNYGGGGKGAARGREYDDWDD